MSEPVRPGPLAEPVRPAAGSSDAPPKPDVPVIKKDEGPTVAPKLGGLSLPPELSYPKVDIPQNLRPEPKAPKLDAPKEPDPKLTPKVPAVGAPREPMMIPAIPSAAPAPETIPTPTISTPTIPLMPDPKARDPLPSLTLPPEVPVAPEKKPETTSRSSPLTTGARDMNVAVYPAKGGESGPSGQRVVGFFNHTSRDINLTIEGRAVKLPARSYLQAQLAPTFTWSHGDRPAARETVPAGAGGVDVVFRD